MADSKVPFFHLPKWLLLWELAVDVAVATSSCHADVSWACRFAVGRPRFSGYRAVTKVLSQDCLGQLVLHPVSRRTHYASLESLVMILPGVGMSVVSKKGEMMTRDSVRHEWLPSMGANLVVGS